MNATPSTVQALIDSGQRNVTLDPLPGYPEIVVRGPLNLYGSAGVVVPKIRTSGYVQGLNINNLTVKGGGIVVIEGIQALRLVNVAVEDVAGVGINVTGYNTQPSLNLWTENVRVRNCHIGMMIGQCIRWDATNCWLDNCKSPTQPNDSAFHGLYANDDNVMVSVIHGFLVSRCPGTGFRGMATRTFDVIGYQCGGAMASGKNCELLARATSIDAGPIEIGSQIPCTVEDPYGGIFIKRTTRSPYLVIRRPWRGPGQLFQDDAHYPIADQDVPGRQGHMVVLEDPGMVPPNPRTPATYCRDVLGGTESMDDLWNRPFNVAAMNRWIREGISQ